MSGIYLPSEEEFDPESDDFIAPFVTKERRYLHFDLPLTKLEREKGYDFSRTKAHRFWPLLGFNETVRRFSIDESGLPKQKVKIRPIKYASHADAAYLECYAANLNKIYESAPGSRKVKDAVLAYRKGGSTNIHHAASLFREISERKNCTIYALDISGFFDHLDHLHLKEELMSLLGVDRLDGHDWNVFNNVTKFSWVDTQDLDKVLGKKRPRSRRICSPEEFKANVRSTGSDLIRVNEYHYGIPQGTPISGLYANIYLGSFDADIVRFVAALGGSYRRYSDDIAIVLPGAERSEDVAAEVSGFLKKYALEISPAKTEVATFVSGRLTSEKPVQYLGFTFDGVDARIRQSSMDAYRRKMKQGIHAKIVAAKLNGVAPEEIYQREALSRYTHLGKRRNFLKYAYRSAEILASPQIRLQVKPHMLWFNRAWAREIQRVYGL